MAIAGTPSLTGLVVPIPPSAPIGPVRVPSLSATAVGLGEPRQKKARWFSHGKHWERSARTAAGTTRCKRLRALSDTAQRA